MFLRLVICFLLLSSCAIASENAAPDELQAYEARIAADTKKVLEFKVQHLVGMSKEDAIQDIKSHGFKVRIRREDKESFAGTCEVDVLRINIEIDSGKITAARDEVFPKKESSFEEKAAIVDALLLKRIAGKTLHDAVDLLKETRLSFIVVPENEIENNKPHDVIVYIIVETHIKSGDTMVGHLTWFKVQSSS